MEHYLIIGAGGHAKIVLDILLLCGCQVDGLTDARAKGDCMGYPILGDDSVLEKRGGGYAAMGIGNVGHPAVRERAYAYARECGFVFPNVIHPSAVVSRFAVLEDGIVCGAEAVIAPGASVGSLAIINTGAVVEHDAVIARGVHIAPRAGVMGAATVGAGSFCGAGSIIAPGIHVGANCIIGAGSVVLSDIPDDVVVVGTPARIIKQR